VCWSKILGNTNHMLKRSSIHACATVCKMWPFRTLYQCCWWRCSCAVIWCCGGLYTGSYRAEEEAAASPSEKMLRMYLPDDMVSYPERIEFWELCWLIVWMCHVAWCTVDGSSAPAVLSVATNCLHKWTVCNLKLAPSALQHLFQCSVFSAALVVVILNNVS
jgi:hypothetical protein